MDRIGTPPNTTSVVGVMSAIIVKPNADTHTCSLRSSIGYAFGSVVGLLVVFGVGVDYNCIVDKRRL